VVAVEHSLVAKWDQGVCGERGKCMGKGNPHNITFGSHLSVGALLQHLIGSEGVVKRESTQ
jgi:hypothetical protein